jgi:hypothetical protein
MLTRSAHDCWFLGGEPGEAFSRIGLDGAPIKDGKPIENHFPEIIDSKDQKAF